MFKSITEFFHKFRKSEKEESKSTAKERLHLVLAQDRANISADFLEMMKQEILEVIKKYIDIDEKAIDVRLTNTEEVSNNQEETHNIEEKQEIDANANDEAEEPNAEEAETDQERVDENAIEEVEDEKKNS